MSTTTLDVTPNFDGLFKAFLSELQGAGTRMDMDMGRRVKLTIGGQQVVARQPYSPVVGFPFYGDPAMSYHETRKESEAAIGIDPQTVHRFIHALTMCLGCATTADQIVQLRAALDEQLEHSSQRINPQPLKPITNPDLDARAERARRRARGSSDDK